MRFMPMRIGAAAEGSGRRELAHLFLDGCLWTPSLERVEKSYHPIR
jgi:hypothetical protein